MNRKSIIKRLQELYATRKALAYIKNPSQKSYDELNKVRDLIEFYEQLIKSDYIDTWVVHKRRNK